MESSALLLRPYIDLLYQPWMIDDDTCAAISGMNYWQGDRNTLKEPAAVPLWPP
jgi:hypothetical protein